MYLYVYHGERQNDNTHKSEIDGKHKTASQNDQLVYRPDSFFPRMRLGEKKCITFCEFKKAIARIQLSNFEIFDAPHDCFHNPLLLVSLSCGRGVKSEKISPSLKRI